MKLQESFHRFISCFILLHQITAFFILDQISSCLGSPLRRHSFSAPARLSLERLDKATENLGRSVLSLSLLVSRSSSSLNRDSADTMPRTCHGCHAPLDEDHQAFPSGWQKCQLEHWEGGQGGVADGKSANGSDWRGCPEGYVFVEKVDDESGSDEEETRAGLKKSEITIDGSKDDGETAENDDTDLLDVNGAGALGADGKLPGEQEETDPEEGDILLQQLEAANLLLKKQAAVREQEMSTERDRKIAMLKAENTRLAKSMKGDIGGVKTKNVQAVGNLAPNPKNSKAKKSGHLARSDLPPLQNHMTRNQIRASEYRPEEASLYSGLNIDGIRKIPVIRTEVDRLIGKVQHHAPSLDSRPSFLLDKTIPLQKASHPPFSSQLGKSGAAIDPETSSDEDVDEQPQAGYVFRWRRDQNGEKYFEEEKQVAVQDAGTDMVYRYVRDETTGRSYKRLVLKTDPNRELTPQWVIDPRTGKHVQMLVPCQASSLQSRQDQRSGGQQAWAVGSPRKRSDCQEDNFVTPLPPSGRQAPPQLSSSAPSRITDVHHDDKQGKMPSIVQYARGCPVSWTSKITSDKLNMGLWSWAYIAELLASRSGQASPLQHGELEARLQHYLNVLEIALQPSNSSDFENHAWKVARLYAEKVQQKVDRGGTWLGFEQRYGSDSQPHELMAAEKELAPKVPKKQKEEAPVKAKSSDDPPSRKRACQTWNTSTVEGKCEYEANNDGRSCSRRHECTWCKDNGKRSLSHQRSFCRQRIAAGEQ